ncbi:MAG: Hsp20/alpha crystallin family protein [Kiritimatiellae bacterium]|nr:Hsp20/alpha crystallin family protein [Kiritimatiellia bacterium]
MSILLPVRRERASLWDVASDLDRVFDAVGGVRPYVPVSEGLWHPTMEVYNRKDEVVVELEIPGVKPEDVDIRVEEKHLVVEGTRMRSEEFAEDERYYSERAFGGFHRVVHLPTDVDDAKAKARFSGGLLAIRLPKKAREGGNKIPLETD